MSSIGLSLVVVVVVVAAGLQVVRAAEPTKVYSGCYEDTAETPIIEEMALGEMDPAVALPDACFKACLHQEYAYAAISDATYCFCTNNDPTALGTGACEKQCDGQECGSADVNLFSVYLTGGGSAQFTMVATNDQQQSMCGDDGAAGAGGKRISTLLQPQLQTHQHQDEATEDDGNEHCANPGKQDALPYPPQH